MTDELNAFIGQFKGMGEAAFRGWQRENGLLEESDDSDEPEESKEEEPESPKEPEEPVAEEPEEPAAEKAKVVVEAVQQPSPAPADAVMEDARPEPSPQHPSPLQAPKSKLHQTTVMSSQEAETVLIGEESTLIMADMPTPPMSGVIASARPPSLGRIMTPLEAAHRPSPSDLELMADTPVAKPRVLPVDSPSWSTPALRSVPAATLRRYVATPSADPKPPAVTDLALMTRDECLALIRYLEAEKERIETEFGRFRR
ncbi:hypothetical protein J8273_7264 [Carpediemonas membranifera]|uniref:Uncharacterized protein n=1 Tax=Carpediemonas membranifera TaxID=201153 RepID=A0A8J6ATC8_9EUKA|nr:hypothetical protein J8273_7264 [Carpediemonas membranifera]|eukprot:KAG9390990.1 hypothetical protein J8273_7264 [Carpediemonas membranifera]